MPSGEVFTGPLEDSAEGRDPLHDPVEPARRRGRGDRARVPRRAAWSTRAPSAATTTCWRRSTPTRARAGSARSASARTPGIDRPIGAILFDEKIGGTVHLAVGRSYPETGGDERVGRALGHDLRPARGRPADRRRRASIQQDGRFATCAVDARALRCPRAAMRRTKIVATIGPASRDPEVLVRMIEAGMDVARLNFSHGTAEEHAETARRVREAASRAGRPVAILQDLPGPKLRIGKLVDDIAELKPGDEVTFVCGEHDGEGDARRMYITWAGPGRHGRAPTRSSTSPTARCACASTATRAGDGEIDAVVEIGGSVASRQGLNIPGETAALPSVPEEDLATCDGREDRRRPRRAVVRAPRRGHRGRARAHAAAADRQDREAAGRPARRGDRARRRLRDGRARRPRDRDADRGGADRPEADHRARGRARPPVDHRDADARLDGRVLAPDARRGRPTSPTRSSTAPTR